MTDTTPAQPSIKTSRGIPPCGRSFWLFIAVALSGSLGACQSAPTDPPASHAHPHGSLTAAPHGHSAASEPEYVTPRVLNLATIASLDGIVSQLADKDVIFVGETHTRYDHHLNQLAIIQRLHARNPDIAIGMEFFQQPFQAYLDDFVAGKIDERELLRRTEYYDRWRFDYRLYKPILDFARANQVPVIALNVPREITDKVSEGGLESLDEAERAQIPAELDRGDEAYRERLMTVFSQHPGVERKQFENFLSVQVLWDEGMADRAARYLSEHPERQLIILAGSGHVAYGMGIPDRLARRQDVDAAIVLQGLSGSLEPEMGDFLLLPQELDLPPSGKLGAYLNSGENGVEVASFATGSAAEAAGLRAGDRILALNGEPVDRYADVLVELWNKKPGERVTVQVRRAGWLAGDKDMSFDVSLR